MSNPPISVTIRYASNQWSFEPIGATVTVPDTYLLFTLDAPGFRLSNPNRQPPEPAAVVVADAGSNFFGPWTMPNEQEATLLDKKSSTGIFTYIANLVQVSTGERVTVPLAGQPSPTITNQ